MTRCAVLLLTLLPLYAQTKKYTDAEVDKIHRSMLLIDTHNDVTSNTVKGFDIGKRSSTTHTDIPRLRAGNVGATFFAVYVAGSYVNGNKAAHRALEMIDTVKRDIAGKYPGEFELATSADGIEATRKNGRMAALMGIEGGHAIEDSLRLLRNFYDLGIRYMTLTHSNNNNWADSSGDTPKHNGLTDFGRKVVLEMNRLGMMVDISHVSDKTFRDVLETSTAPVFASHSSCRALSEIPRNMTDDMIRVLAKKGGVVQINFGCDFLAPSPKARATLADVVAHIGHIVKIAGVDHVGIGSDFDGVRCVPEGLEDVSRFPNLTRALLKKGYATEHIAKIYGGNLLRVMREVERTASAMR
ncbi:MAG TPA: dipeptidase [Bryobacteraceae bacterium]|nr:dipeptidase [Bryobacteraceae bacterium]